MDEPGGAAPTRREVVGGTLAAAALATWPPVARAADGPREVPARSLPVPTTVSPELQAVIARPLPPGWDQVPADAAAWRALAQASADEVAPVVARIEAELDVRVTPDEIAGVPVFRIAPATTPATNRNRLLMHLHGGGYVLFPGEAGAGEAMLMAAYGGFEVVSVDYRMPPDHPFPAALDDAVAVWKTLLAAHDPGRMAVFGSSAGGGLTLALMLKLKALDLPLPAAIAPGTPWIDLTGESDSLNAHAFVDNALVSTTGWVGAAAPLYAGGHDLADPLVSPIFGDFAGLPPAILTSGTRDLLLSDTVRAHRRLRRAGVEAALQVFEGESHAQFLEPFVPETEEAFREIAGFLGARLGG
jgi:acetyl esterase/lipase